MTAISLRFERRGFAALACAGLALLAAPAHAQDPSKPPEQARLDGKRWSAIRERTVSATDLLRADLTNLLNPLGSVRDLVLSDDSSRIQYVLCEVPYPYHLHRLEDGFVAFQNAEVTPEGPFGVDIRIDDEISVQAPEELELTRADVDHRLVSGLLDRTVTFADGETRRLQDMLVDRRSGAVTHLIVDKRPDAFFNDEPSAIPIADASISKTGEIRTTRTLASLRPAE